MRARLADLAGRVLPRRRAGAPHYRTGVVCAAAGILLGTAVRTGVAKPLSVLHRHADPAVRDDTVQHGLPPLAPDTGLQTLQDRHDVAVAAFAGIFGEIVRYGGILTDELRAPLNGFSERPPGATKGWAVESPDPLRRSSYIDARILPERRQDTAFVNPFLAEREIFQDMNYSRLQGARVFVSAISGQLTDLAPARPASAATTVDVWRSELYSLEGYTDILLADMYCSGVPLNTPEPLQKALVFTTSTPVQRHAGLELGMGVDVDDLSILMVGIGKHGPYVSFDRFTWFGEPRAYVEDVEYPWLLRKHLVVDHPSSTTAQVYRAALANFDTALSLARGHAPGSARMRDLARVGKGRALLALGEYAAAAKAVAGVSKGFVYDLRTEMELDPDGDERVVTVSDREGRNGLPYISSGDPRTATRWSPSDKVFKKNRWPARLWPDSDRVRFRDGKWDYSTLKEWEAKGLESFKGMFPFTLASWEEAVLIRAEAALHATSQPRQPTGHTKASPAATASARTWLHLLNQLRAEAPIPGTITLNPAALPPLRDPGTDSARIALMFAERAAWLFFSGHRQGDLRRLVREYHWPQQQVYPTGPYIVPPQQIAPVGEYGTDVNMPIPPLELENPSFHGCLDRGA